MQAPAKLNKYKNEIRIFFQAGILLRKRRNFLSSSGEYNVQGVLYRKKIKKYINKIKRISASGEYNI